VECLVALVVCSLGALGAAGTAALGVRIAANGNHVAAAARLTEEVVGALRLRLRLAQGSCAALTPGSRIGPSGLAVNTALTPVRGGVGVILTVSYATPGGQHVDTIHGFLSCH
jgi:hypothetical protein